MPAMPDHRTEPAATLAASVLALVEHAQVPLASKTVRVLVSFLSGKEIAAEHLGRIAAYERERLLAQRAVPRLCSALVPDGTALVPRVWCAGSWPLARRIRAGDAVRVWPARAAQLCAQLALQYDGCDVEALKDLTSELVGEALGPIFQMPLESRADWQLIAAEMGRQLPGPGVAQPSTDQEQAAALLDDGLPAVAQYFGMSHGLQQALAEGQLRAADDDEDGSPLIELLRFRTRDAGRAAELAVFLCGMAMLARSRGRPVSPDHYAEANGLNAAELRRLLDRWQAAMPEDPQGLSWRLSRELRTLELDQLLNTRVHTGRPNSAVGSIVDPVHGLIALQQWEGDLLGTVELQRLRSVALFGSANLRFPGAGTTWLEHAMRSAAVAGSLAEQVASTSGAGDERDLRQLARAVGLVKDVGRLPFQAAIAEQSDLLKHNDGHRLTELAASSGALRASAHATRALRCLARPQDASVEERLAIEIAQVASWIATMQAAAALGLSRAGVVAPSQLLTGALIVDHDGSPPRLAIDLRTTRSRLRTELVEELIELYAAEATMRDHLERDPLLGTADAMITRAIELWLAASGATDRPHGHLSTHSEAGLVDLLVAAPHDAPAADDDRLQRAARLAQAMRERRIHKRAAWTDPGGDVDLDRCELKALSAALTDGLTIDEDDVLLVHQDRRVLSVEALHIRDREFNGSFSQWRERTGMAPVQPMLGRRVLLSVRPGVAGAAIEKLVRRFQAALGPDCWVAD
ncbi:MAG: uncharacterized protein V7607_2581 [Solirubrobacteraceae bacterium]